MIYYDKYGTVMAAGAEADNSSVIAQAEDENWIKAELYVIAISFFGVYFDRADYRQHTGSNYVCVHELCN